MRSFPGFRSGGELLALTERGQTSSGDFGLRAGRVEADEIFVELLRVDHVVLPLFKFGRLEQLFRLIAAAGGQHKTQDEDENLIASVHQLFPVPDFCSLVPARGTCLVWYERP